MCIDRWLVGYSKNVKSFHLNNFLLSKARTLNLINYKVVRDCKAFKNVKHVKLSGAF